ncbi:predicted protein [Histoplasma capsulatum G186AR]|uniref:Uncharacterized protein n=1 Tax=Ajellomyces capsulatus (strain G186AR / H82 / ATCC MYA-2454 / RMSCC 2432) TaxID=447093 RepID=C0NPI0_AJECG|nr:uncharacterized protein HCBG_05060 [Histoplasma capsulatum G186AR]EEH06840.1 predicted protein [Histoplasma capsulatum G186AR]
MPNWPENNHAAVLRIEPEFRVGRSFHIRRLDVGDVINIDMMAIWLQHPGQMVYDTKSVKKGECGLCRSKGETALISLRCEKVDAERSVGGYYMFQCNFVGVAESCNDA